MGGWPIRIRVATAVASWAAVAVVWRRPLEASMVLHALVQLPLLVAAGALLVPRPAPAVRTAAHPYAPAVLLVALFTSALWMLPRLLDGALGDPALETAKLLSLPFLAGAPLRWSWPRLTPLARSFVVANAFSMLLTLGWLYHAAPMRVCSYYLRAEQQQLGTAYLTLAALLLVALLPRLFSGGGIDPDRPRLRGSEDDPRPHGPPARQRLEGVVPLLQRGVGAGHLFEPERPALRQVEELREVARRIRRHADRSERPSGTGITQRSPTTTSSDRPEMLM